jgi:hypothetical protein
MASQKKTGVPSAGGSSDPGQEVRPDELPTGAAPREPAGGAIPIGVPIPVKDHKALETKAKSLKKPPAPGIAQSDPGEAGPP